MAFDALEVSLALIPSLRGPVDRLGRVDADLARQVRRAASSIALNVAEGRRRRGGDRLHLWRVAAGSAAEVGTALRVAAGWGHVDEAEIGDALALVDRLLAMLHRMTRR
mgnify:CR=1 FL=1